MFYYFASGKLIKSPNLTPIVSCNSNTDFHQTVLLLNGKLFLKIEASVKPNPCPRLYCRVELSSGTELHMWNHTASAQLWSVVPAKRAVAKLTSAVAILDCKPIHSVADQRCHGILQIISGSHYHQGGTVRNCQKWQRRLSRWHELLGEILLADIILRLSAIMWLSAM